MHVVRQFHWFEEFQSPGRELLKHSTGPPNKSVALRATRCYHHYHLLPHCQNMLCQALWLQARNRNWIHTNILHLHSVSNGPIARLFSRIFYEHNRPNYCTTCSKFFKMMGFWKKHQHLCHPRKRNCWLNLEMNSCSHAKNSLIIIWWHVHVHHVHVH